MTTNILPNMIAAIDVQLSHERNEPFAINEEIVEAARNQFTQNFNRNWYYSKCSTLMGIASLSGFGFSIYKFFSSKEPNKSTTRVVAIGIAVASFVLNQIWVNTRNREGYALDNALCATDEDEIIRQLSLGANIHQEVWSCGGAVPNLFPILLGGSCTVVQWFARQGYAKVVAYLIMLEPNSEIRKQVATDALRIVKDNKTAKLLIELGGDVHRCNNLLFSCCLRKNLELVSFFVQKGASLNAGIDDYVKWEADYNTRNERYGGNWYEGNIEGVDPNLHPMFKTPLEWLLESNFGPNGSVNSRLANNPSLLLESLGLDPNIYRAKDSPENLHHALNQAGIRIRLRYVKDLFNILKSETPPTELKEG